MSWTPLYEQDGASAREANLVRGWRAKLTKAGFDDPKILHPFAFADLAEDLVKHRVLLAYNMGTGKTAAAIASAVVRDCKHTLIIVPNKLIGEWEKELARLGRTDYQIITKLSQLEGYKCPTCDAEVETFRKVLDADGKLVDVKRECPTCKVPAVRFDRLKKLNLISMRTLWTIPADSPHAGRETKKPAIKDKWGGTLVAARPTMKYCFAWYLRRRCENVMIDEAYSLGNPDSLQTRAITMLKPRRRTLLTGTPVRGYPDHILTLLNWCLGGGTDLFPDFDPTQENSRKRFLDLFGSIIQKRRDDGTTYDKLIPKIKNPDKFQRMLAPVMRRRVNLEPAVAAAVDMPEFHIFPIEVEADPLLAQMYEDCASNFVEWFKDQLEQAKRRQVYGRPGVTPTVPAITLLTKLNYLAHLAACPQAVVPEYATQISAKQVRILNIIKDAVSRGRKVILYSEFVDSVEWYGNNPALADLKPVTITGTVSLSRSKKTGTSERDRRLEQFRSGDSKLLVATTKCVAEGFNIPEASVVIFDSYNWTPAIQQQAWSRVLRPAQKQRPVEIYLLGVMGTIDSFLSAQSALKRLAIGEGIDYETVEIEAEDVPDPVEYAKHIVDASGTLDSTYNAEAWIERLKRQMAEQARKAA